MDVIELQVGSGRDFEGEHRSRVSTHFYMVLLDVDVVEEQLGQLMLVIGHVQFMLKEIHVFQVVEDVLDAAPLQLLLATATEGVDYDAFTSEL